MLHPDILSALKKLSVPVPPVQVLVSFFQCRGSPQSFWPTGPEVRGCDWYQETKTKPIHGVSKWVPKHSHMFHQSQIPSLTPPPSPNLPNHKQLLLFLCSPPRPRPRPPLSGNAIFFFGGGGTRTHSAPPPGPEALGRTGTLRLRLRLTQSSWPGSSFLGVAASFSAASSASEKKSTGRYREYRAWRNLTAPFFFL